MYKETHITYNYFTVNCSGESCKIKVSMWQGKIISKLEKKQDTIVA